MKIWHWVWLVLAGGAMMAAMVVWVKGRRWRAAAGEAPRVDATATLAWKTYRLLRMMAVLMVGTALVLAGVVMALPGVPGPGLLVMLAGLAVLATEFIWAEVLLRRLRGYAKRLGDRAGITTPELPEGAGLFRRMAHGMTMFWVRLARRCGLELLENPKREE